MTILKLNTNSNKLTGVNILEYRKGLELLTGNDLEEGLETPREIKYYFIPNRGVAANIGAATAHEMGIPVIFTHDGKDLPYDSIKKDGDMVLNVKSYVEKEVLPLEKVENILKDNGIDENFSDEELSLISKNSNLLDLLVLCKENDIEPNTVAIDPWYGMKSEDPEMIKVTELLGFNFIGPSSEAVALIGDKVSANKFAENTNLKPAPNTGELTSENVDYVLGKFIKEHKDRKIVLKAADGGGGSGQFLIDLAEEGADKKLIEEAKIWLEKGIKFDANLWIDKSRHIEMQVIVDGNGKIVFGTPRNCTSQRAKQKIIEETANLTEEQVEYLENAAKEFFKQVEEELGHPYKGPATFEILQDVITGKFYFLEVNTRKQVEILVTEHQTDKNYVKSAIEIARGYTLKDNDETNNKKDKHVIEARITLESTLSPEMIKLIKKNGEDKVARPEGGEVEISFDLEEEGVYLYFDERVLKEGKQVANYDSMVGQLVVEGKNRKEAIEKLERALKKLKISGLPSNKQLCLDILGSEEFKSDTHNSKTPTVKNYIKKEHKKMARKKFMEKLKSIFYSVKKAVSDININKKNLDFTPEKTISLKVNDTLLESILKLDLIDGVFAEYNGNGYNLMFESENKITEFREYLESNGITEDYYMELFKKLGDKKI